MKKTHAEVIKEIKKLEDEKQRLIQQENNTCTVTFTEDEEPIDTGYNYDETNKTLLEYDNQIRKLKAALAKSNATTIVEGFDMSISEALVYLAQLQNQLARYKTLSARQPLERNSVSYRKATYEYTKTLYDVNEAKRQYQECFDLISKLQMAIDLANLTTKIDC